MAPIEWKIDDVDKNPPGHQLEQVSGDYTL